VAGATQATIEQLMAFFLTEVHPVFTSTQKKHVEMKLEDEVLQHK